MTANSSLETVDARGSGITFLKCLKKRNELSTQNSISSKNILEE